MHLDCCPQAAARSVLQMFIVKLAGCALKVLLTCHDLICLGQVPLNVRSSLDSPACSLCVSSWYRQEATPLHVLCHIQTCSYPNMQGLRGFGGLGCSGSPPGVQVSDVKAEGRQRSGNRAGWEAIPELSNAGGECCFPASWPAPV